MQNVPTITFVHPHPHYLPASLKKKTAPFVTVVVYNTETRRKEHGESRVPCSAHQDLLLS